MEQILWFFHFCSMARLSLLRILRSSLYQGSYFFRWSTFFCMGACFCINSVRHWLYCEHIESKSEAGLLTNSQLLKSYLNSSILMALKFLYSTYWFVCWGFVKDIFHKIDIWSEISGPVEISAMVLWFIITKSRIWLPMWVLEVTYCFKKHLIVPENFWC